MKKIFIYVSSKDNLQDPSKLGGIESLNYNLFLFLKKLKFNVKYANKILEHDKTIIWDVIISSNESRIFSILRSKKNILWMHNLLQIEKAFRKKQIWSIVKNKINTVFVSKYLDSKTTPLYFFSKTVVINNFLEKSFLNIKKNYERKPMYIWSTRRAKGLNYLVYSWTRNFSLLQNSELHIFGLRNDQLPKELTSNKLKKYNIFIHGFVNKKTLINYYSLSSGIICPGYDETFCLNAIEGNSAGLPILTFGLTNLKNLVVNESNGFIVKDFTQMMSTIFYINHLQLNKRIKLINSCYKFSKKYYPEKSFNLWKKFL